MKKLTCIVMVVIMILSVVTTAFADDTDGRNATINSTSELTADTADIISNIPLFITFVSDWNDERIDSIKENANFALNHAFADRVSKKAGGVNSDDILETSIIKPEFRIIEASVNDKQEFLGRYEFSSTFRRVSELVRQDVSVNYINLFLPSDYNVKASGGDTNDPSYWENLCPKLCPSGGSNVYKGYKFLYLESSVNVETTPKVAGNIASMNWTSIIGKITKLAADVIVKDAVYQTASVAYEALSAVFGGYSPPYSVTYSAASGYLKTWVSGDLYMRTILISDNLNRVNNYAYYDWGLLESFKAKTKVDAKWPVSVRPGGTYNYETCTFTYPRWRTVKTPGFNGNLSLYKSVINLYENTIGYFTHVETVDVYSVVASLI